MHLLQTHPRGIAKYLSLSPSYVPGVCKQPFLLLKSCLEFHCKK